MIVVDTSAVLIALLARPNRTDVESRLLEDGELQAPHLIDVELLHVLRRFVNNRALTQERALQVRDDFAELAIERYPHHPLGDRIWQLRANLTAYDAAFVALSELLAAPLITCDGRLKSPGHNARVEVYRA